MPCYHPLKAHKSPKGVTFKRTPDSYEIPLPCGQCIGCRLERSRQWAVRLVHENRLHTQSSFITLTYAPEYLPKNQSLDVTHFQKFMKRLRKKFSKTKIKFFHAGEYGEENLRPHYHAIIFGLDFIEDSYEHKTTDRGDRTWRSKSLDELWSFGHSLIGAVTFESCAYVARYITKKITGPNAKDHYTRICATTGEIIKIKPEYCTMSRNPGIGKKHFERFVSTIYNSDTVIENGKKMLPPKYYDRLLEKTDLSLYQSIKDQRECALSLAPKKDKSDDRLAVREVVKQAQIGSLKRKL